MHLAERLRELAHLLLQLLRRLVLGLLGLLQAREHCCALLLCAHALLHLGLELGKRLKLLFLLLLEQLLFVASQLVSLGVERREVRAV